MHYGVAHHNLLELIFLICGGAVQIENKDVPGLSFKTHPNIHKELFNSQQIVGAKDPNRPFPSGQNETPLVKWRIQGMNESNLPLSGAQSLYSVVVFY